MVVSRQKDTLIWLFVLILFVSIPPFYVWHFWSILSPLVALIGCLMYGLWQNPVNPVRRFSLLLFVIFYLYASLYQYEDKNMLGMLWAFVRTIILITIFLISEENWLKIYNKFVLVYSVLLVPSLIVYFLVYWGNVSLPYKILSPLNELKEYLYIAYPFLIMEDSFESIRFCGYFDEPGVIGTISGVLLVTNRCHLKDWKNIILLISGIFSFSLFFYVILFLYIILFGSKSSKIVVMVIVSFILLFLLSNNNPLTDLIISRLEFGSDGEWAGDNRTIVQFDVFWKRFVDSDSFWYGYGKNFTSLVADTGGASYKHLIVDFGFIMFVVYILAFVLYYASYRIKIKDFLLLLIIFSAVIFQRPFVFYFIYLFLIISPAAVFSNDYNIKNNLGNK